MPGTLGAGEGRHIVVSSGLISVLARSLGGPLPPYAVEMLWPRRTALAAAGLTAVLLVAAVMFTVHASNGPALANLAIGLVVAPLAAVLGVFTSRRNPGAQVGMWLALLGLGVAAIVARETWSQALVAIGGSRGVELADRRAGRGSLVGPRGGRAAAAPLP